MTIREMILDMASGKRKYGHWLFSARLPNGSVQEFCRDEIASCCEQIPSEVLDYEVVKEEIPRHTNSLTIEEVLSAPPLEGKLLEQFYDMQDVLGIHWYKRPKRSQWKGVKPKGIAPPKQ